jgi:hypothetical protein
LLGLKKLVVPKPGNPDHRTPSHQAVDCNLNVSMVQYCEENDWHDFFNMCRSNAQRISKLMAEAADDLMPEPAMTANLKKDVFDVLLHNVCSTSPIANKDLSRVNPTQMHFLT